MLIVKFILVRFFLHYLYYVNTNIGISIDVSIVSGIGVDSSMDIVSI